jgi:hypothetical protein
MGCGGETAWLGQNCGHGERWDEESGLTVAVGNVARVGGGEPKGHLSPDVAGPRDRQWTVG